jgi:ribose-phosphate pyrophosphokinase
VSAVVFGFPGHERLVQTIAREIDGEVGALALHRFPDREMYIRLDAEVALREVILVCGLHDPDAKTLPLLFAANAAKDLGARRVGVVAPYLGYLRQDTRFKPGEAITSATFGRIVSAFADWIITVDPHLHRYSSLGAVYSIPGVVAHAASLMASWIRENVDAPVLIGPDSESEQWVAEVAHGASAPYVVLAKTRRGERDVSVSLPQMERWRDQTPVLVDDIISTARTMVAALSHLNEIGFTPSVCVGIHGIFADDAYEALKAANATRIVTCNTVPHESNGIDVDPAIAASVAALLTSGSDGPPCESPRSRSNGAPT